MDTTVPPVVESPPPATPALRKDAPTGVAAERLLHAAEAESLGRLAETPAAIPWPGWRAVIRRTAREMLTDRVALVAAGCAFYATLALFPVLSMLVALYGLVFDPVTVEPQLETLRDLLPPSAFMLIEARIHQLVAQPPSSLHFSLVISSLVAFWSCATGTKSMLGALNVAYEERETRSVLRYQLTAFIITIAAIVGAAVGLAILVGLPALLAFLGVSWHNNVLIRVAGLVLLLLFVMCALAVLYRYGPAREAPRWQWVTPGSVLATLLWVVASTLFSLYVGRIASYDLTYGPLGAVVGVMMWFYVTVYVVLLGAELNAELELQTARDSTEGPSRPLGARGAYVADHVAMR